MHRGNSKQYGQPRQLVQSELGAILNAPTLKFGDSEAFDAFSLSIQSLVGMLRTLEGQNGYELRCGSHVDRLLSKMPPSYRDGFVEYCLNQGILRTGTDQTYTLPDLSSWLQMKSQAKRIAGRAASLYNYEAPKPPKKDQRPFNRPKEKSTAFLLTASGDQSPTGRSSQPKSPSKPKPYCPHCDNKDHFLNACTEFKKLNTNQVVRWIKDGHVGSADDLTSPRFAHSSDRATPAKSNISQYYTIQSSKPRRVCSWRPLRLQKCTWIDQTDPPR